ncbi:hypothetical protein [Clostridium sp.]|uniref:hypothetical protein n=1 Tax=Clostridium sp. TaxID=1506 RepID=UPI002FC9CD9C
MLLNVLNNKIKEVQAQQELAMGCCCQDCSENPTGTTPCATRARFTVTTVVRGTVPTTGNVPITLEDINLRCVREKCFVEDVEVPNPCPSGDPLFCTVCLTRFRYIGCINYAVNIPLTSGAFFTCFRDCVFVDSIRCYSCAECEDLPDCPPAGGFILGTPVATIDSSVPVGNTGFSIVTFTITIGLTSPCAVA